MKYDIYTDILYHELTQIYFHYTSIFIMCTCIILFMFQVQVMPLMEGSVMQYMKYFVLYLLLSQFRHIVQNYTMDGTTAVPFISNVYV